MFESDEHQLLDFGDGRRLERFGSLVLDRPCLTAESTAKADPALWERADARFVRTEGKLGQWLSDRELPERWTITHGPLVFELKRTEFGHLGVFAEQADNWDWISERLRGVRRPLTVLNLFGYTGGSTLAAAAAGAEVVHVDAARNVVAWARRNAELSGLADAPIRWITEEAMKFVGREIRRGNRYDAVILDPPSYGHGPRGEVWRLSKHLAGLVSMCGELTAGRCRWLLLTCHTPKFDLPRLAGLVSGALGAGRITARPLTLEAATGRRLPSGEVVGWEAEV